MYICAALNQSCINILQGLDFGTDLPLILYRIIEKK